MVRSWFTNTWLNHVLFPAGDSDVMTIEEAKRRVEQQGFANHLELDPHEAPMSPTLLNLVEGQVLAPWTSYFSDGIVIFSFSNERDAITIKLLIPN